jgi:predicted AAA+ superfamily ATPase
MNINKLITLALVLPALTISLSGCRGSGKYVDDFGQIAGKYADNFGQRADNNTDEIIKFATERLIECAKGAGKSSVEQTLKTAISSGYKQVSVEYLLNVSMNAIQQECVEVQLAKMTYNSLSRKLAESSVSSAKSEYQGQIEFVLP